MIRLVDRLLRSRAPTSRDDTWDDAGVEDIATLMTRVASAEAGDLDERQARASRASVLVAYAASQRSATIDGGARSLSRAGAMPGVRRGGHRPATMLLALALIAVLSAGAAAAAAPGGLLYEARVATEALFLPADPAARLAAQLSRLDERVAEAVAAKRRGDEGGAHAALSEYASIALEAAAVPGVGMSPNRQLAARVREQLAAIEALDPGDPALAAFRTQVREAVRSLLSALGEAPDDARPGGTAPASPDPSTVPASGQPGVGTPPAEPQPSESKPGAGGAATPSATKPAGHDSLEPGASSEPIRSGNPPAGPRPSASDGRAPGTSAAPGSTASPSRAPGPSSGPSSSGGGASISPGGGSGSPGADSGSPGGGSG